MITRWQPLLLWGCTVLTATALLIGAEVLTHSITLAQTTTTPQTTTSQTAAPVTTDVAAVYDPLIKAIRSVGQTRNFEAGVPPQCYTKTDAVANPCWTCHVGAQGLNFQNDWALQEEYAFSDAALTNHWSNLYVDRSVAIAAISDEAMTEYIRTDNYTPLQEALAKVPDYPGYIPDLDFAQGFDDDGFAVDGSNWRAIRYKPFLGTFWPTNGSTDDVFIRLPESFRTDAAGQPSREIYKINLAIVEAAIATDPTKRTAQSERQVEPINEIIAGLDLDGDGKLSERTTWIRGLPTHYVGAASGVPVMRYAYPKFIEFLHTVRYIDMDNPSLLSIRMKEVRYSRKTMMLDRWALSRTYEREFNEKDEGLLPVYTGSPTVGLRNSFGWQLQGYIEDEQGRLRLQTEEEHRFCMGCHSAIGVTVDQTFTLARKVPGADGWGHQYLTGMPDVPQLGHDQPEILTYFERVTGGDEFRANDEILARFFPGGVLDRESVLRAAPGGDQDIRFLIAPSRERAALLNKAYMALVEEQRFELGRDAIIKPTVNVHGVIENGDTELNQIGRVFTDGTLWLDWSGYQPRK